MFAIPCKLLKSIRYFVCLLFFLFLLKSCEKTTSPFSPTVISLKSEYVGVTEADLRLSIKNLELPLGFQLFRDDSLVGQGQLTTTDTLLMDTLLLPAQSYTYQAILLKEIKRITQSEPLTVTTMDTTSHKFQWEVYPFESPYGSAALYDVAIIDENNIWAVGEIYADSAQPWLPYNAVHWDGQRWELKRITYGGSPWPIKTIWAFTSNNIWFDAFVRWNGGIFIEMPIPNILIGFGIKKMWGSNPTDMYVVGTNGLITHYNGNSWQKLESGTELPIKDIWGVVDWKTDEVNILAVACNLFSNDGIAVLQIAGNSVNQISTTNLPVNISSVWSFNGWEWYICGSRLYKNRNINQPWKRISGLPSIFQQQVRGKGPNNIFVVGHSGLVLHWNGFSWRYYPEFQGIFLGLAIKDDLMVAVGSKLDGIVAGPGIILVGRMN
ncbi:MAG: hypothetical protein A2Y71_08130 [Bacteroidetes bacterium RBG_13_42_15]|nr:MAG: hypothetical protein A2Y71_08130 [Bacteroidetes bacterium RBG_13_42_15]